MQRYMMQVRSATVGLPWEYKFEMASDRMAKEYVSRHAKQFAGVSWFMSLLLWRYEGTEANDYLPIAEFVLNEPTVREAWA
jgi:hypothetical protein